MLASGFNLRTDHHFQVAMHNNTPVTVWQHGDILDYGGPIDKFPIYPSGSTEPHIFESRANS